MNRLSLVVAAGVVCAPVALRADVFTDVPEASGYSLVYTLPVSAFNQAYDSNAIPYTVDNSLSFAAGSFTRVAYYLELAGSTDPTRPNGYVYASFDKPAQFVDGGDIGVPSNGSNGSGLNVNTAVTDMNVFSNSSAITTGLHFTDGKIQFWPSDYGGDFKANSAGNNSSGHGAMQIHHTAPYQTLFGYSDWGGNNVGDGTNPSELGLGTNTGGGFNDWTFSDSGTTYTVRNLQILVLPVPEPGILSVVGLAAVGLLQRRRQR